MADAPDHDAPDGAVDGRSRRWDRHNQTRRAAIIAAAIDVLEELPPGEDFQVQQVAEKAGIRRPVIYRYFGDRGDLDREVQREICARLGAELGPALAVDGTPEQILRRIIDRFVRFAAAHPGQYRFVERDLPGWGPSPLQEAFEELAAAIERIVQTVIAAGGVELEEDDLAGLDPWVFGMVGAAFSAVRRWLGRDERAPDADAFIEIMSESIWFQLSGMAASRGVEVPDARVVDLMQGIPSSQESQELQEPTDDPGPRERAADA